MAEDHPKIIVADDVAAVAKERGLTPVVNAVQKHFQLIKVSELAKLPEEQRKKVQALLMVWFNVPEVTPDLLHTAPGLKYVQTCTKGVNHIDLEFCFKNGIRVGNLPDVYSVAVAEHAIALMFSCTRHIVASDKISRSKASTAVDHYELGAQHVTPDLLGTVVNEKNMGIIGLGAIGLHIAQLGMGLNMKVVYNDIRPRRDLAEHGLPEFTYYPKLEDMLAVADVVILALPSIPETRHMMGRTQFMAMKPEAVLVNIARGDIIDTDAMVEVMKEGHIQSVALDVTDPEPLPEGHPLLKFNNVTLSPHMAYYSDTGMKVCAEIAMKAMLDFHAGKKSLDNEVDLEKGF